MVSIINEKDQFLTKKGINHAIFHGSQNLEERNFNLEKFQNSNCKICLITIETYEKNEIIQRIIREKIKMGLINSLIIDEIHYFLFNSKFFFFFLN